MKSFFTICTAAILLGSSLDYAQKLKTETIKYSYKRLPALPVTGVTNYQVTLQAAYEAQNAQLLKDYNQQKALAQEKYSKELAAWPENVKAANARYEKELAEYNKKPLGKKLAEQTLLNDHKPVKEIIPRPYLENVQKPTLQSSYDYGTLGDTYIRLEGYQNASANALKIIVLLYGYDHTLPRSMDEQQENLSIGGGRTGTYKTTLYHTEFSYRHPMAVKVYTPDGKEILSITPPELNSYKIYKSNATNQPVKINTDLLVKNAQEKVLQDNLRFINTLLNDKYGYASTDRIATLYYIKNGDNGYTDLTTAFNEASSGLVMLQQDAASAQVKMKKACDLWATALKEADLNNKKARINKDIATSIYFNLLETYFALGDVQNGQITLDKVNTLSLSNTDRKTKLDYDMLFAELKNRQQHN